VIRAHQPGSEPIDIPETIPNPAVVPKPTPTPTKPVPKEPVRIPEFLRATFRNARATGKAVSAVAERLPAGRLEKGRDSFDELCAAVTRERGRTDEIWQQNDAEGQ
jgi:hypothetical protein